MGKPEKFVPELMRAAAALEDELAKLETLSRTVRKTRLDSEKNILKAAKELNEALKLPERLAEGLGALAAAMQQMQSRQQTALEPLAAYASEIQQRRRRLEQHMQAFAALGRATGDVSALLQSDRERAVVMGEAKGELTKIAADAQALLEAARVDDFPEVAREAEALKQRVSALRRHLEDPRMAPN
jgi:chromosome segregation ATPase